MTVPVAAPRTTSAFHLTTGAAKRGLVSPDRYDWMSLALVAATLAIRFSLTALHAADAVINCGNGRCTVYLSKSETRTLGEGRVPAPPATLWWQLKAGLLHAGLRPSLVRSAIRQSWLVFGVHCVDQPGWYPGLLRVRATGISHSSPPRPRAQNIAPGQRRVPAC